MARNTLGFDAGSLKLASPSQSLAAIKGIPGFTNGKKRAVGAVAGVPVVPATPATPGLWAWGQNAQGSLGLGNTTNYSSPKQVGALITWNTVAGGNLSSFAIKTDGTLWSWGFNTSGRLGLGDVTNRSSPVQIGALTTWSKIASGISSAGALAIKTNGTLWSWGDNASGQLGLGNTTSYSSPKQVGALTTWSKVASGDDHLLAIKTGGTLWAWGYNGRGQLGLGDITNRSSPVQVGAQASWSEVAGLSNGATLAIQI